eukprot:6208844-Pleurochrysis_carterae.AAC.2
MEGCVACSCLDSQARCCLCRCFGHHPSGAIGASSPLPPPGPLRRAQVILSLPQHGQLFDSEGDAVAIGAVLASSRWNLSYEYTGGAADEKSPPLRRAAPLAVDGFDFAVCDSKALCSNSPPARRANGSAAATGGGRAASAHVRISVMNNVMAQTESSQAILHFAQRGY